VLQFKGGPLRAPLVTGFGAPAAIVSRKALHRGVGGLFMISVMI